jgi:cation:H+ antiporter
VCAGRRRRPPQPTAVRARARPLPAIFAVAAVAILISGVAIERSGEQFFGNLGLSGVLFGATILAAATSLPELSTGITSAKLGDYQLTIGDIFGANAFLPVLFLPATVIAGGAVLPAAGRSDIYLTALGPILTIIYMAGLVCRPAKNRTLGCRLHSRHRYLPHRPRGAHTLK